MVANRFRHELKYVVSLADAEQLFTDLLPYCEYDKHAGELNSYEIASVYYDTADLRFYWDREESVGYRRKIRLRSYNRAGESNALFVEIKEKHKNFVNKKRINLNENSILNCGIPHYRLPLDQIIAAMQDSAEAREFSYLHRRLGLIPIVIIRYIRKALIPQFEDDMRITLDTKITAGGHTLNSFDKVNEKHIIAPDQGILEVKSNQSIPLWLNSILRRYELVQTRYSKYCLGVTKIYGSKPVIPANEIRELTASTSTDLQRNSA
jgi:SPX domain protein involved in polyphosphate accumulation